MLQQFTSPGKKFQPTDRFRKLSIMFSFKNINADILSRRALDFSQQLAHERLPAHADAPMYLPLGQNNALAAQRVRPCVDMFINAVDKSAVQIEQHGGQA